MPIAFALVTAAAAALSAPASPEAEWTCHTRFELDGHTAWMWRDFDAAGAVHAYFIQTDNALPHAAYWTIDPRPDGPPPEEPVTWLSGRSEAAVLRDGPDSVHIDYTWLTEVKGPVYAYFWGDGKYAGVEQLFNVGRARPHADRTRRMGGLSGGLHQGPVLRSLYGSHDWAVKVVDATGKELYSETFRPPDLARSVAAYRERRAEIESLEAEFRTDFKVRTSGATTCSAIDPEPQI